MKRGNLRLTENEVAVQLANLTNGYPLPDDMCVVIFVFRDEPETGTLHSGFISMTPLGRLRLWIEAWLHGTEDGLPDAPRVQ